MQLTQRRSLFTFTTVTLSDRVRVVDWSWFRSVEAEFAIDRLSEKPLHFRFFPIWWAVFGGLFALGAATSLFVYWRSADADALGVAALFGFFSLAFGYNTLKLRRNDLVFRDRHTQQALFSLRRSSPSSDAVDQFVRRLQEVAHGLNPPFAANRRELQLFYSGVLHQLLEAGVLLPAEHEVIQARMAPTSSAATVLNIVR